MITEEHLAATCRICLTLVGEADVACVCPSCHTTYHRDCWNELGGCAVYGCARMAEVHKAEDDGETYWGASEKVCPVCAERIAVGALMCRFCETRFPDARPLVATDVLRPPGDPSAVTHRRQAIWLLVSSLIGVTSPLALLFGGLWYRRHRERLAGSDPATNALAKIGLGVAALYLVLICVALVVFAIAGGE